MYVHMYIYIVYEHTKTKNRLGSLVDVWLRVSEGFAEFGGSLVLALTH